MIPKSMIISIGGLRGYKEANFPPLGPIISLYIGQQLLHKQDSIITLSATCSLNHLPPSLPPFSSASTRQWSAPGPSQRRFRKVFPSHLSHASPLHLLPANPKPFHPQLQSMPAHALPPPNWLTARRAAWAPSGSSGLAVISAVRWLHRNVRFR